MAHPMYWVTALTYAVILFLILLHDRKELNKENKEELAFHKLLIWVLYFCLQDTVWGICASTTGWGNVPLFVASTLFHASTVATTYFWLNYVLIFLGDDFRYRRLLLSVDVGVIAFQIIMLVFNMAVPIIFTIQDGLYCTERLRPLAFFNQYAVYLLIGGLMLFRFHFAEKENRRKSLTVFCFALAPILTGVFQLLYPNAPFYSIGYFLGTVIIHLFIVQNERIKLRSLHHEMENQTNRLKIAEQIALSNTDILTGLHNRRAYEEVISTQPIQPGFVYVSVDVNELKVVNDNLGHAAGDELLLAAADVLQNTLGTCGEVFRIGGDEFAALLYPEKPLNTLTDEMTAAAEAWRGEHVPSMSLSFGTAAHAEFPDCSMQELGKKADSRMYAHKAAYYISKGTDRQGIQKAYYALCGSYEKILRVDLTHDTFRIIAVNGADIPDYANETTLSGWLEHFGRQGMVHPEDVEDFLSQTDRSRLQEFFTTGGTNLSVFYRRLTGDTYHQTMMEIMQAEDFTPENQHLYLYVKDIDRTK